MDLKHVVVTSVDRDDVADRGAGHYAATIRALKRKLPDASVEVLTPDFLGVEEEALQTVMASRPDVFNHNIETVRRLHTRMRGAKAYVEAAGAADVFLVTARDGEGLTQVLVPADTPGVTVTPGRSIDLVRRYGSITFDGARVPTQAVLGEVGGAAATVEHQLEIALALQCAESVGAADRVFAFTVEYAQDRFAFGRPIASFQALKHRIADMLQWLEFSKAIADAAANAIDRDDNAARFVSVAKAYIGDRCLDIIDDCVQINGGIGMTWEHDIHLYSRRVALNRAVYGSPEEHKERLCALLDV
jgi:alkylation response protein AidB-like acyl-CoA dehydrogenase